MGANSFQVSLLQSWDPLLSWLLQLISLLGFAFRGEIDWSLQFGRSSRGFLELRPMALLQFRIQGLGVQGLGYLGFRVTVARSLDRPCGDMWMSAKAQTAVRRGSKGIPAGIFAYLCRHGTGRCTLPSLHDDGSDDRKQAQTEWV